MLTLTYVRSQLWNLRFGAYFYRVRQNDASMDAWQLEEMFHFYTTLSVIPNFDQRKSCGSHNSS